MSIKSKFLVFNTLAISKLVYLALFTVIANHAIYKVAKIQKSFICDDSSPKIKHETLGMDIRTGGLKMLMYVLNCKFSVFVN